MEAAQACRLPHGGLLVLRYLAPGLPWAQLQARLATPSVQPQGSSGVMVDQTVLVYPCQGSMRIAWIAQSDWPGLPWAQPQARLASG